jgi:DNA ligase (NAD+)
MSVDELVRRLEELNRAYRQGTPLVPDEVYDALVEELRTQAPDHPFLHRVEPEEFRGRRLVPHPAPMLSTEKAYTPAEVARFVERAQRAGQEVGVKPVLFRLTPKLDGLAGRDDGTILATRGDGVRGYDITHVLELGVVAVGGRGLGLGEIVLRQSYFQRHLAAHFEHPRNVVVGIVHADAVNPMARHALDAGAVLFVPYSQLPAWEGPGDSLLENQDAIQEQLAAQVDYPLDGFVLEVVPEPVRQALGATSHHYRWQLAIKRKGKTAVTTVEDIAWQVGRTGKITPVLRVTPVSLSGATIRRVSGHNAGMVQRLGLGPGARIVIIRSGEVIPKVEEVVEAAPAPLPATCPSCASPVVWRNDFLVCENPHCPARQQETLEHWFRTLDNAYWFGPKTVARLVAAGIDSLDAVYRLTEEDFRALGFGPVQAANLAAALTRSAAGVEDWRFLAALGIDGLGLAESRRLLEQVPWSRIFSLTPEEIQAIPGFGPITARSIVEGLQRYRETVDTLLAMGFVIRHPQTQTSPLAGKRIVFTGTLHSAPRTALEEEARTLGALVGTTISRSTDYLVCGDKPGSKLARAQALGIPILDETAYRQLVAQARAAQTGR